MWCRSPSASPNKSAASAVTLLPRYALFTVRSGPSLEGEAGIQVDQRKSCHDVAYATAYRAAGTARTGYVTHHGETRRDTQAEDVCGRTDMAASLIPVPFRHTDASSGSTGWPACREGHQSWRDFRGHRTACQPDSRVPLAHSACPGRGTDHRRKLVTARVAACRRREDRDSKFKSPQTSTRASTPSAKRTASTARPSSTAGSSPPPASPWSQGDREYLRCRAKLIEAGTDPRTVLRDAVAAYAAADGDILAMPWPPIV